MFGLRYHRSRVWILACCVSFTILLLLIFQTNFRLIPHPFRTPSSPPPPPILNTHHWPSQKHGGASKPSGPCVGPRGTRIDKPNTQDLAHGVANLANTSYPVPTYGSYEALGLPQTWMTFSQRYGPYGYGEDEKSYPFTKVDWNSVNWGQLQDRCLLAHRRDRVKGLEMLQSDAHPRFRLLGDGDPREPREEYTGRQAIVLRAWSTYDYKPEDFWSIRAMISEAGLAAEGEYTVVLLVDVKHENGSRIHEDDDFYQQILEESVPHEFRDIAVLFHESLQQSWYKKVDEFEPEWQIMQPLQLFAHFYPEFDHYWQFEMDARFTGDVGKMLRSFHHFGNQVPYKQSRERASWTYMPSIHGTYSEFAAQVNKALDGSATVWGPIEIKDIPNPVGGYPPVSDPKEDMMEWGMGHDADVLLLSNLVEVARFEEFMDWVFKDWLGGFNVPAEKVPRFTSAPAQARASRTLLEAIHTAQHEQGLRIPSEATLPSFALWHGLKTVALPHPKFNWPARDVHELDAIYNGGEIADFKDGIANGPAPYRKTVIEWYTRPRTWEWRGFLTNTIYDRWMHWAKDHRGEKGKKEREEKRALQTDYPDELPGFMRMVGGEVYLPGLLMHPRKTNHNV